MMSLHQLPEIVFGRGVLEQTGEKVRQRLAPGAPPRVLLVTTRGMPGRPAEALLTRSLAAAELEIVLYAGTPAEPGEAELAEAVALARRQPLGAVLGFGGGSALDLAKLVAVQAVDERPVGALYGIRQVGRRGLPTAMLPTTAGSGSEVSQDAVLTDRRAGTKRGVKDPALVPDLAVIDPAASDTCPPEVTAASGLDALCHAIEAWTGRWANPLCDLYAERAIRLVREHLVAAVAGAAATSGATGDGVTGGGAGGEGSRRARDGMAEAALLAGLAFSPVGTAAVHACGYPLSGLWGLSHGLANALVLPAVVELNAPAAQEKTRRLAALFATDDLAQALRTLIRQVGLPCRLRDAGVDRSSITRMAAIAAEDRRHLAANPRPMAASDLEEVFTASW